MPEIFTAGRRAGRATHAALLQRLQIERMRLERWTGRLLRVSPASATVETWLNGEVIKTKPARVGRDEKLRILYDELD